MYVVWWKWKQMYNFLMTHSIELGFKYINPYLIDKGNLDRQITKIIQVRWMNLEKGSLQTLKTGYDIRQ